MKLVLPKNCIYIGIMEDKNYKLVEDIVKTYFLENQWCEINIFKNNLQKQLNQNL